MSEKKDLPALPEEKERAVPIQLKPAVIDRLDKFKFLSIFGNKLKEFNMQIQSINEMEITTKDKHEEAELKLRILKNSIDYIKDTTNLILEPYKSMVTDCEDASNELLLQIKEADRGLRDKIISFQKLHAASASGDINKDYEDKKALINNTIALNEKVNIICKQLIARLIGGIGPKLDGTSSTFAGVHNEDDCDRFIEFANDKFPDSSQYGEFASMIQYAKDMGIKIAKFNKMIFELKSKGENVFSHEDDLKKMYNVFNVKTDGDYLTAKATLEKKLKKNDADFNKELKSLTKGIIYTWDFTVENTVMVPEEYKSVDDKKIKSFIKDHKEGLEGRITKLPNGEQVLNEQPIPGIILFRKEQKRMS